MIFVWNAHQPGFNHRSSSGSVAKAYTIIIVAVRRQPAVRRA